MHTQTTVWPAAMGRREVLNGADSCGFLRMKEGEREIGDRVRVSVRVSGRESVTDRNR